MNPTEDLGESRCFLSGSYELWYENEVAHGNSQFPAFTDTSGVIKAECPDIEQER